MGPIEAAFWPLLAAVGGFCCGYLWHKASVESKTVYVPMPLNASEHITHNHTPVRNEVPIVTWNGRQIKIQDK